MTSHEPETVTVAERSKPVLSQAKLDQLEHARKLAMESRRRKMREKLEAKLSSLRAIAGDLTGPQMERVAYSILEKEEQMRHNHNLQITALNEALTHIQATLNRLVNSGAKVSTPPSASKVTVPLSEVSSVGPSRVRF